MVQYVSLSVSYEPKGRVACINSLILRNDLTSAKVAERIARAITIDDVREQVNRMIRNILALYPAANGFYICVSGGGHTKWL